MIGENIGFEPNIKYHNRKKIITLRKSRNSSKKLFFLHNGAGRINAYFLLSELVSEDFSVYGITLTEEIGFVPQRITVKYIAEKYIEEIKKVQPQGPYYLAGWCVGGNIVFEMACQLEKMGEEIGFCGLLNTHPPKYYPQIHPKDFSAESEIAYIIKFIKNELLQSNLSKCEEVYDFWKLIKDELKDESFDKALFIKMDEPGFTFNIPDIDNTSLYDMLYGINIVRTLHYARASYEPDYKLKSPACFINASINPIDKADEWNKYCQSPAVHMVEGDHFSMFEEQNVHALAQVLNKLLKGIHS